MRYPVCCRTRMPLYYHMPSCISVVYLPGSVLQLISMTSMGYVRSRTTETNRMIHAWMESPSTIRVVCLTLEYGKNPAPRSELLLFFCHTPMFSSTTRDIYTIVMRYWLTLMSVVPIILGPELGHNRPICQPKPRVTILGEWIMSGYQIVTPVPVWAAAVLALSLAFGRS